MSSTSENGSATNAMVPSGDIVDVRADIVDAKADIVDAEDNRTAAAADPSETTAEAADSFLPDSMENNGFHTPPLTMNGLRNGTHNGVVSNASAQAVLQRGMEILKESEVDNGIEEIKKLDSQIDHFNNYLDKFEARNKALNEKLNNILETQKQERLKRRASFQQKEAEYKEQNDALEDQMRSLLNRCHQARRISAAPDVPLAAAGDQVIDSNGSQSNGSPRGGPTGQSL